MADITRPRAVFAPADYKLISRALEHYKNHLVRLEESERTPSLELTQLANLMHRLGRR
jgi:hypothetical protein